jgi:hypothetical protein
MGKITLEKQLKFEQKFNSIFSQKRKEHHKLAIS